MKTKPKILIVENNIKNADFIKTAIETSDYEITIAENGISGLNLIEIFRFNIVLLNMDLPDISGFNVIEFIRKTYNQIELPIVIMHEGLSDEEKIIKALESGANDYIPSPMRAIVLRVKIRNLIQSQKVNETLVNTIQQRNNIFKHLPIASMIVSENGTIREMNDAAHDIFNIDQNAGKGKLCGELISCINTIENGGLCGTLAACNHCIIRNSYNSSFITKSNISKQEGIISILTNNKIVNRTVVVNSIFIDADEMPYSLLTIEDVTDRREAEETVRTSEERLRLMIESSNDMITIHDLDGKYLYYSGPEKYKINTSFAINKTPFDFFEYEIAKQITSQILKTAQTGEHSKIEIHTNWQGELIWFEEKIYPTTKNGKITSVVKICSDITARKNTETELVLAKEKAETSEHNANERIKELTGIYSLGLLMEKFESIDDVFKEFVNSIVPQSMQFPDLTVALLEIYDKQYINIENFKIEKKINRLTAPISIHNNQIGKLTVAYIQELPFIEFFEQKLINEYAEKISKTLEQIQDRTELINAKLNAEDSDRFNTTMLQTIPFGMDIVSENGDILFQNDILIRYFGENKIGLKCWDLYHDDKKQCHNCPLNNEIKIGQSINCETGNTMGGKIYDIIHTGMYFKGQKALLEIFIDITDRKKDELIIQQQNIALNELNITKDKFLSILAHDLKNPFNSILGFSALLINDLHILNSEKIKQYAEVINSTAKQTYQLLENLLEWAKLQQYKTRIIPDKVKLSIIANESVMLPEDFAKSKNIEILQLITDEILVLADPDMLKTVFRNLITNAIKFTPKQGRITISVAEVESKVQITISDTGTGMSTKQLNSLFKIGEAKSTPDTSGERGTGFGLLICSEFIKKMGGEIWVESEINIGTSVYFTIPRALDNSQTFDNKKASQEIYLSSLIHVINDNRKTSLKSDLQKHIFPKLVQVQNVFNPILINELADKLIELNEKHEIIQFKEIAEQLYINAQEFDVEEASLQLSVFNKLMNAFN